MTPGTIITTIIDGDSFVASTPNLPGMEARGATESRAINELVRRLRAHIKDHQRADKPVPWVADVTAEKTPDTNVRLVTGCAPDGEIEPILNPEPAAPDEQEHDHGD